MFIIITNFCSLLREIKIMNIAPRYFVFSQKNNIPNNITVIYIILYKYMLYIKDNRQTVPIIDVEMRRLCRIYILNKCKNKKKIYNNNKLLYKRWTL